MFVELFPALLSSIGVRNEVREGSVEALRDGDGLVSLLVFEIGRLGESPQGLGSPMLDCFGIYSGLMSAFFPTSSRNR